LFGVWAGSKKAAKGSKRKQCLTADFISLDFSTMIFVRERDPGVVFLPTALAAQYVPIGHNRPNRCKHDFAIRGLFTLTVASKKENEGTW